MKNNVGYPTPTMEFLQRDNTRTAQKPPDFRDTTNGGAGVSQRVIHTPAGRLDAAERWSNFMPRNPGVQNTDITSTILSPESLRKLLRAPYYESSNNGAATSPVRAPTGQCNTQALLNGSDSSTIMNDTSISIKSTDSSRRFSSRNSWRFWDNRSFRDEQKPPPLQVDQEEEIKSVKRNRYKSKIERGRQNFLQHATSTSITDPDDDRQKKYLYTFVQAPLESIPLPEYLEPTKTKENDSTRSTMEFKLRPPTSKYDSEYEAIVRKAEEYWSAYKRRLIRSTNKGDLYAKSRALSTGILETDVDTGRADLVKKSILETDLDKIQGDIVRESKKNKNDQSSINNRQLTLDRAKSADRLFEKKSKIDSEPPENDLRKSLLCRNSSEKNGKTLSEHELRFRKSTEKLHIPDWYLKSEYFRRSVSPSSKIKPTGGKAENSRVTARSQFDEKVDDVVKKSPSKPRRWTKNSSDHQKSIIGNRSNQNSMNDFDLRHTQAGTMEMRTDDQFYIPKNFFDKYKDEIEELRQSRTGLTPSPSAQEVNHVLSLDHIQKRSVPVATVRPTQVRDDCPSESSFFKPATLPVSPDGAITPMTPVGPGPLVECRQESRRSCGWTVSRVPDDWNISESRWKLVVEVASEIDARILPTPESGFDSAPPHLALDAVLDSMISAKDQRTQEGSTTVLSQGIYVPTRHEILKRSIRRGIFSENELLMEKCLASPSLAPSILKDEPLWIQCSYCHAFRQVQYPHYQRQTRVSCSFCFTYYCDNACHLADSLNHTSAECDYARVGLLCNRVTAKVQRDPQSIYRISSMVKAHYSVSGRGSVNVRFASSEMAARFVENGWRALDNGLGPTNSHMTYSSLAHTSTNPQLATLCQNYDPATSFVLNVSIAIDCSRNWQYLQMNGKKPETSKLSSSHQNGGHVDYTSASAPLISSPSTISTSNKFQTSPSRATPKVAAKIGSTLRSVQKTIGGRMTAFGQRQIPKFGVDGEIVMNSNISKLEHGWQWQNGSSKWRSNGNARKTLEEGTAV